MRLTGLARLAQRAKFLVNENSTTILTSVGVIGTISTAYLTGRASFRAAQILEREKQGVEKLNGDVLLPQLELTLARKIKLLWRLYIPPIGAGITTIASIIFANKIASKKMAALAVASGISERALQEYKAKVVEKLGARQDTAIRDEIAQDRINNHPVGNREVILAGTGEVLCYDMHTGRYFQSSVEEIKRAENKVNHDLINFMHASLSEFYDAIGLPATSYSDSVGWNANHRIEVTFSTTMSSNNQPCIAIDFVHPPTMEYAQLYD